MNFLYPNHFQRKCIAHQVATAHPQIGVLHSYAAKTRRSKLSDSDYRTICHNAHTIEESSDPDTGALYMLIEFEDNSYICIYK